MNSEVVDLASQMVKISSVNPQDRDFSAEPYGEERMVAFVSDWLKNEGLDMQLQEVEPKRENVLSLAEGSDSSQTLLLSAHLDTVDVKGMTIDPFGGEVRDGRLYGRGACDDKGPLAALMIAYRDRVREGGKLPCNLALLATCGEEYDLMGAKYFVNQVGGNLRGAVFAEPTGLKVVVSHKGALRIRLRTKGKSAHSSTPQAGDNAIYRMGRVLGLLEEYGLELTKTTSHPCLGHETLATTIIQGGQQVNVIPDMCEVRLDWRILPSRPAQQCVKELSRLLEEGIAEPVELKLLGIYEAMETDQRSEVVKELLKAVQETIGKGETASVVYSTDASAMTELKVATPIFGPGSASEAHTADEFISIEQLEKGLAAYKIFLRDM